MVQKFKKIIKNKTMLIFILFTLLFLPSTIYLPAESNRRLVVSAVGVDKTENDEIELSVLMLIPKSEGNIGNNYQLVSSKGKNLADALSIMGTSLGKLISFAHCELIITSIDILKDDLAIYLDFFTRTNNLTSNADLLCAKNAKETLEANINISKEYSLGLKDILTNNKSANAISNINVDSFLKNYLSNNNSYLLPFIKIKEKDSSNTTSSNNESSGNEASSNSNTSQPTQSNQSTKKENTIDFDGSFCLLKNGKYIETISSENILGLNIINNDVKKGLIKLKNVSDTSYSNADVTLELLEKKVKQNIQIINNKPYITFDIFLFVKLEEIFSDQFNPQSLSTVFNMIKEPTLLKTTQTINEKILYLQSLAQKHNVDIFNIVNMVRAHHLKFYKEYTKTQNPENLISDSIIVCNYEFAVRN